MLINKYVINKEKPMGFGDFIRGCITCHQISLEENFEVDIDLGLFSKYYKSTSLEFKDTENIIFRNEGDFIQFKKKLYFHIGSDFDQLNQKDFCITTNVWPSNTIENKKEKHLQKDWGKISKGTKELIKSKLIPKKSNARFLNKLPKKYEVVHIRAGDFNSFKTSYDANNYIDCSEKDIAQYMIFKIAKILRKTKNSIVILSDSILVKKYINKIEQSFQSGRIFVSDIKAKHSGIGGSYETFHDLTILNNSKRIHQFSVYSWGSGFSNIAHHIYDIPIKRYKQIRFDDYFKNRKIQRQRSLEQQRSLEHKPDEPSPSKVSDFKSFIEWHIHEL